MTDQSDFQKILAKPAQRALAGANIETLEQLSKYSEVEIMELHGIGQNAFQKLQEALSEIGLSFASKK
ncbi:DNA-directed RNA polymerase subunit alpha C-terminal domain-containing protein [Psychrobacillus sp. FJAT-51614]|uniref:DNA-directed RNA polymerase subunit alpha C-terminal domain-containing protein n=1 Tax=Psychrobacillus mangrovi TaxID=3117745 RepID=A0ABU8F6M3_9BACI